MRKLILSFLAAACLFGLTPAVEAQTGSTQDFTVQSFDADYYLSRDANKTSLMDVKETIVAQFPASDQNHGILRAIPETYQGHTVSLTVKSVQAPNGNNLNYTTYGSHGNLVVKVGDANTYVHGSQTYIINYSLRNVAAIFPDHNELYWDVNGDQWQQVFGAVNAKVHLPTELAQALNGQLACYVGAAGSTEKTCSIEKTQTANEVVINTTTKRPLKAGENMTYVVGFNKDTFVLGPEIARDQQMHKIKVIAAALSIVVPPAIAAIVMYRIWRKLGDDPEGRGIIIPEYEPPKGLDALHSYFLLNQKLEGKAVSAMLIEMAVQGHVTIYEIPKKGIFGSKDYELELKSLPKDVLPRTREGLEIIFGNGLQPAAKVKISELKTSKSNSGIYKKIQDLGKSMSSELFQKGYFSNDPLKIRNQYFARGGWVLAAGLVTVWFIGSAVGVFLFPLIGLALAGCVVLAFAYFMPARTPLGVEAHDKLLGLKDYIKLAEADRLKFLQSPEGAEKIAASGFDPEKPANKVKLFEHLLPYAMIFGLEKDWAKQFKDIYNSPPDWYRGDWTTFNAVYLASSIGSFSAASATSFSPPSSSGGSGFSGGSSGGGGGGGGGGGW